MRFTLFSFTSFDRLRRALTAPAAAEGIRQLGAAFARGRFAFAHPTRFDRRHTSTSDQRDRRARRSSVPPLDEVAPNGRVDARLDAPAPPPFARDADVDQRVVERVPLVHDGWTCRRIEVRDEAISLRFGALGSNDTLDVELVPLDAPGPVLRRLERAAVRYRANVPSSAAASRSRLGDVVVGTANAIDAWLASTAARSFTEAFGRRASSGTLAFSADTLRELLAPDFVEGAPAVADWTLRSIAPRADDDAVELSFSRGERTLAIVIAPRDDARPARARTTHLSISHQRYEGEGYAGADALLAWLVCLLEVRDHAGLDLVLPPPRPRAPGPAQQLRDAPRGAPRDAREDAWARELAALREELAKKNLACIRPWVSAERLGSWQVLPCCQRFLKPEVLEACDPNVESLVEAWNAPGLQAVRRAIASGRPHDTCREDCPTFHGENASTLETLFDTPKTPAVYENVTRVLREMIDGVERVESVPLHVQVTVEEDCNIRCVMCSITTNEPGRQGGGRVLDAAQGEEIVSLFPKLRTLNLIGGEPTMAPVTREILAQLDVERFPDADAQLITNGILLTPKYTEALKSTRLVIMVSLNAATSATFEKITGRAGAFERIVSNVRALLDPGAGFAVAPTVVLSFVVMKDTYLEVPAFLRLAAELGCPVRLQAVYGELGGQSIFTDEALLGRVSRFFDEEVSPNIADLPDQYRASVDRVASMMRSRLERRDFSPY